MTASDSAAKQSRTWDTPLCNGEAVSPSDSAELSHITRAIYVGTGGHLAVVLMDGPTVAFENVPTGTLLPIRARKVKSTGTAAQNIVALW